MVAVAVVEAMTVDSVHLLLQQEAELAAVAMALPLIQKMVRVMDLTELMDLAVAVAVVGTTAA
jgi:hypothetical protein